MFGFTFTDTSEIDFTSRMKSDMNLLFEVLFFMHDFKKKKRVARKKSSSMTLTLKFIIKLTVSNRTPKGSSYKIIVVYLII